VVTAWVFCACGRWPPSRTRRALGDGLDRFGGYVEHRSIDGSGSRMHLLADVALGHVRGESFEGRVHLGVVHDAG